MTAVIFVGPSLQGAAPDIPGLTVLPPAAAGDVFLAAQKGAQIIGLIDARFENEQTVRHDEILYALHLGVHVLGASSMGALRALECAAFGVRGYGRIYEMYRDGLIDGDHEVALQYGPAELGWPALSIPLVNVRATLDRAVDAGALDSAEARTILGTASAIYYKDLTWPAIQADLADTRLDEKLSAWLPDGYVDQKAQDANELLDRIKVMLSGEPKPFVAEFDFQPTLFWQQFVDTQRYHASQLSEVDSGVLDELRLDPIRYSDSLQRAFARRAANHVSNNTASATTEHLELLRTDLGLMSGQAFHDWLVANRTDENAVLRFLDRDSQLEFVLEQEARALEREMLDELRAEDQFAALDTRAIKKRTLLEGRNAGNVPAAFADFDLNDLLQWFYQSRRITGDFSDPDDAARSLGLADRKALHILLRREFEYDQAINGDGDESL